MSKWNFKESVTPALSDDFKKRHITDLKGKEYITVNGLLSLAHEKGVKSIETELVQFPNSSNDMTAIFRATVVGYGWDPAQEKVIETNWVAYGDASPTTTTKMVAAHFIRMAETRAVGRVLRNYTNIGMTSAEELGSVTEIRMITADQYQEMVRLVKEKNLSKDQAGRICLDVTGKKAPSELTFEDAVALNAAYRKQIAVPVAQTTQQTA